MMLRGHYRYWISVLLLFLVVWAFYATTVSFDFIRLDDHDYTFRCFFVKDGLSWSNIQTAFTNFTHAAIWMPLTYLSYMLDISLLGPGMCGHHFVNVLLHAVNVILVFAFLRCLRKPSAEEESKDAPLFPALLAATFWAIHPVRVEAVAWIAARKELLFAFFTLLGLLSWLGGRRLIAFLCMVGACLSKPTAICFPLLVWSFDYFNVTATSDGCWNGIRKAWRHYLPFLLLAFVTGLIAIWSQTHPAGHEVRDLFQASLPWRILNALVAFGLYIRDALLPLAIHADHRSVPGAFPLEGICGLVTLGLTFVGLGTIIYLARRGKMKGAQANLLFAGVFFFAALLPTLGIFGSFGEHARTDRFVYLPAIAISFLLMRGLECVKDCVPVRIAVILALVGYGALAVPPMRAFRDDEHLFMRVLSFDPENGRALSHVGQALCARGTFDQGITMLEKSVSLRPRFDTAAQLAFARAMRGRREDFARIRILGADVASGKVRDEKGQMLEALGAAAASERNWDEAIRFLMASCRAPKRFYSNEDACLKLAICLFNVGRRDEAERLFVPLVKSSRAAIRSRAEDALVLLRSGDSAVLFP